MSRSAGHYMIRKGQIIRTKPVETCRYAECSRPVHALGRCHWNYMQRWRRLAELKSQSEPPDSGPLRQHQRRGQS